MNILKLIVGLSVLQFEVFGFFKPSPYRFYNQGPLKEIVNEEEDFKIIYNNNFQEFEKSADSDLVLPKLNLLFYGQVTDESCMQLTNALFALDQVSQANAQKSSDNTVQPIELHIQSYGGSLMPSFYVCDVIKNLDTPVYTYIDGYAASAATIMSVCGKKRYISRFSKMLIHQLSTGSQGKAAEIIDGMENVNLFMENIRTIYLENSKLWLPELNGLLSRDIWLNSTRCLEYGLVDEIIGMDKIVKE